MTDMNHTSSVSEQFMEAEGRRRQLRALLITAADAARQGRRIPEMAGRITRPMGRAVRDRVSTLLTAAR